MAKFRYNGDEGDSCPTLLYVNVDGGTVRGLSPTPGTVYDLVDPDVDENRWSPSGNSPAPIVVPPLPPVVVSLAEPADAESPTV